MKKIYVDLTRGGMHRGGEVIKTFGPYDDFESGWPEIKQDLEGKYVDSILMYRSIDLGEDGIFIDFGSHSHFLNIYSEDPEEDILDKDIFWDGLGRFDAPAFCVLEDLLEKEGLFNFTVDYNKTLNSMRMRVKIEEGKEISIIQGPHSYGGSDNQLEVKGALTNEELEHDSVLGFLTPDEVFKRIKYCITNKTTVYKEE